ncbi:MAG TPA: hypothetical protein VGM39_08520, partial [Kofleriaceae bacterium]
MSRLSCCLLALAACGDNLEVFTDPPSIEVAHYAAPQSNKLDMLFVVDNTMLVTIQHDIGNQLGTLFDAIAALPGDTSVHVGVTTTDLGTTTSLDRATSAPAFIGCSGVGADGVLTIIPDGTTDLAVALNPLLQAGSVGCDFEQPLGAMARVLDSPLNADFLRDDANLLVVLLSDEDDCSVRSATMFDEATSAALGPRQSFRCTRFGIECDEAIRANGTKTNCHSNETSLLVEHVGTYVKRLQRAKPDPTRLAVYAMSGPSTPVKVEGAPGAYRVDPTCYYSGASYNHGAPGVRLQQFTSTFGPNGDYGDVCQSNFIGQMNAMAALVKRMAGVTCLDTSKL